VVRSYERTFKWFEVTNANDLHARRERKKGERRKGKIAKLCQIGVTGNFTTCPCKIYRFIYMLLFGSCRALIPSTIDELFIKWMPLLHCVFRLIVRLFLVCCKRRDARIKLARFFRVSSKTSMNIKISRKNSCRVTPTLAHVQLLELLTRNRQTKSGKLIFNYPILISSSFYKNTRKFHIIIIQF